MGRKKQTPEQKALTEKVKAWKVSHPDYLISETYQRLESRVSDSMMKKYRYNLPYFFTFVELSPDQVIQLREQHIETKNEFFETKMHEFKKMLVDLNYSKNHINSLLGNIAGFFSNYSRSLSLDLPKSFWKLEESAEKKAERKRKNPPSNKEVREVLKVADRRARIAILLGYQSGLAPVDISKLSWANLSIDFQALAEKPSYEQFAYIEHEREKTGEEGIIIISPDLFSFLYAEYLDQAKPNDSTRILNYRGEPIHQRHFNQWFNDCATKALGEKRAKEITFYNLRDSFNNVIKTTPELKQETADRLMGHSVQGSRANYYVEPDYILEVYRDQIFPRLTVNGWKYEKETAEFGAIMEEVDGKLADYTVTINKLQEKLDANKIELEKQKNLDNRLRMENVRFKKQNLNLISFLVTNKILTAAQAKELRDQA